MSPTIDELLPLSKTLNAESDDLNKTIATINKKLAALNFGIEVWLGAETHAVYGIGYAKTNDTEGTWQLAYRPYQDNSYADPLLKASRDARIEGLRLVPMIVNMLKAEAQKRILVMQEAKTLAAEL